MLKHIVIENAYNRRMTNIDKSVTNNIAKALLQVLILSLAEVLRG
jgi:hypothetical protein